MTCAQGFKGMKSLVLSTLFNCLDMRGSNPLWPAVGYSGVHPGAGPDGASYIDNQVCISGRELMRLKMGPHSSSIAALVVPCQSVAFEIQF